MKVLTDTHTLVWALSKPEVLGKQARLALAESAFTASVANLWELILKKGKPGALVSDPVDRILVAQAIAEDLTLVTKDSMLARYGVPVVW